MKRLYLVLFVLLAACATNPELTLQNGYKSSSATVQSTTVLVQRDQISTADAQNVLTLGKTAKATLDAGKEDLKKCRATPGAKCDSISNINLGAGVLQNLETFLKSKEGK